MFHALVASVEVILHGVPCRRRGAFGIIAIYEFMPGAERYQALGRGRDMSGVDGRVYVAMLIHGIVSH